MPKVSRGSLALASYEDIFAPTGNSAPMSKDRIITVPLSELHDFDGHPFQVRDDEAMKRLVKSVERLGVLDPAIVRPRDEGGYEMLTGHRRKRACIHAGMTEMPVVVRDLDDDTATLVMVDSNLEQRETLLPSEKAWAYRMKLEALNHRGARHDSPGQLSVEVLIEQTGESKNQIYRTVRLTELVPVLADMVDEGRMAMGPAVELSYLSRMDQNVLADVMNQWQSTPSLSQAQALKKFSQAGGLTLHRIESVLTEPKKSTGKVTFPGIKLKRFFPPAYTPKQMEDVILRLLEDWYASHRDADDI